MTSPASGGQLGFQFPLAEDFVFADFTKAGNDELVANLRALDRVTTFSMVWVWGLPGRGKSHLLQATCHQHDGLVAYLPAQSITQAGSVLDGLGGYQLVVIDDLQAWLGSREVEAQLMAIHTSLVESGGHLLVASQLPPKGIRFALPDLASRAVAAEIFELRPVAENALPGLLTRLAKKRGLVLEREVVTYWLSRRSRELSRLVEDLDTLDRASLSLVRRLTVPFLKDVLKL